MILFKAIKCYYGRGTLEGRLSFPEQLENLPSAPHVNHNAQLMASLN